MGSLYKLSFTTNSFRIHHSSHELAHRANLTHDDEDEINIPGKLESLLLEFSSTDYHNLPHLNDTLWRVARAAAFYSNGLPSCPAFFETDTIDHTLNILCNEALSPEIRMGSVVLLSTIFPQMSEEAQFILAAHPIVGIVVELTFSMSIPFFVSKSCEFLCNIAQCSESARDHVLSFLDLPSVLEMASRSEQKQIRDSLIQLISFLCYHPLDDKNAQILIEFLSVNLQIEESGSFFTEKLVDSLYFLISAGRVEYLRERFEILDVFPALLESGTKKTMKNVIRLLNLLVDVSEEPLSIDWGFLLNAILSPSKSTAIQALNLMEVLLTKSDSYFRVLIPKKLVAKVAQALEDQAFTVRVRIIHFVGFLVRTFSWIVGDVCRAQIVQKMEFSSLDSGSEAIMEILRIVYEVFSHCEDSGLLISVWNQFCYAQGREFLERLSQDSEFPEIQERADAIRTLINGINIEELPDVGGDLVLSSDDEVVDADPFGLHD
jgi:hypothetical protein